MSCFICDKKTIDRILNYLSYNFDKFENMDDEELEKFGQKMVNMNYEAWSWRYNDNQQPYVYSFEWITTITPIQALKSLNCFLYQCCEGNIQKKKIYKELEQLEIAIMNKIINGLDEYEKAEWG